MDSLRGLAGMETELNPRHIGEWPHWIGQFFINFASIELISYQYLNRLEASRADFDMNLRLSLAGRVGRIRSLAAADPSLPPDQKKVIDELWSAVAEHATWRNRIAHNPILLSWKPGAVVDRDPPDELGVIEMRALEGGNTTSPTLSLTALKELVRWSAEAGTALNQAARKIRPLTV